MAHFRTVVATTAVIFASALTYPSVSQASSSVTVVAVGDIAYTAGGSQGKTAALTKALKPKAVILIGDIAYGASGRAATYSNFQKKFLPKWGSVLKKYPTYAVPGNHEYNSSGTTATGYAKLVAKYKLPKTGTDSWWVKNKGAWTIIGLDSEGLASSGSNCSGTLTDKGTRQIAFIQSALASHDGRPTIVTWHRPRYSSGDHGDQTDKGVCELWNTVKADTDVKVVLWGHDHNYERVSNKVVNLGQSNQNSLTTFVIGTGGAPLRECPGVTANTNSLICGKETKVNPNYGVLKLTLKATSFSWSYRQVSKTKKTGKVRDSGTIQLAN